MEMQIKMSRAEKVAQARGLCLCQIQSKLKGINFDFSPHRHATTSLTSIFSLICCWSHPLSDKKQLIVVYDCSSKTSKFKMKL